MINLGAGERLQALRALLKSHGLAAYYVPSEDAHASEYIAKWDGRRAWLTGFTGSAGCAVVTHSDAALWTDGRYFSQAGKQLDNNVWTLMKAGLPETPKKEEWLISVGVDPKLIAYDAAQKFSEQLSSSDRKLELVAVEGNLVDAIWLDRSKPSLGKVIALGSQYCGRSVGDKLEWLRSEHLCKNSNCYGLLVTALDEIAWLFNLRGSDIPFNPVFFSYALIIANEAILFVDEAERLEQVPEGVMIRGYSDIFNHVSEQSGQNNGKLLWVGLNCNWALVMAAGGSKRVSVKPSPIVLEKAIKNKVELEGFRQCHIRDAAAVCKYFSWLERALAEGKTVSECHGADVLESFRREAKECVGLSFDTISGAGPNGAIIHYKPEPETCAHITCHEMYLCDSGGQYFDGTTDITRTVHFGTPTEYEKECFTAVLKGFIALARSIFPKGTKGIQLDILARQHLWALGLDYRHGTGHGVGHFLNVHEGPHCISYRSSPDDADLRPGMTVTDEPGYYEDGKFGIRIENVLAVREVSLQHSFVQCFGFETVTLVPIQKKLIAKNMLTEDEVHWLNRYHEECKAKVSSLLKDHPEALSWLARETAPL